MSIYLTAFVKTKPGHSADLKPFLLDLVKASRTEAACLQYELYQSTDNEDIFVFHEEWADQAGLDLHGKQKHIADFAAAATPLLAEPITIYRTDKIA